MTIALSQIMKPSTAQAFRGLVTILNKAKAEAEKTGASEQAYLSARLFPDMSDMKWQVQMITEFAIRGTARMTGVPAEKLPELAKEEDTFDALIARIGECAAIVEAADDAVIDGNADMQISMPVGPEQTMELDGQTYVMSFYIPNLFFHVTTAYNLLRAQGVPVGKRDFMGM